MRQQLLPASWASMWRLGRSIGVEHQRGRVLVRRLVRRLEAVWIWGSMIYLEVVVLAISVVYGNPLK